MNTPDLVVGIDLGTTNSSIAVVINGNVSVIPVAGQPSMPSAVGLDPTGKLIIGQAAKNQSISAPESTLLSIKRLMGTEQTVQLGGKDYRPEEISALILGELKRAAETHLKRTVTHAVITVPAFFNERQRQATQDAGKLAGLEVMRIINEPTAAALAYGAGSTDIQQAETMLVYDLGGGTFDVSLVRVDNGVVEVLASHGDTHLGGDDFDVLLATNAEQKFRELHPTEAGSDILPAATQRRLKAAMEIAKIRLSDEPYAAVREEYITPTSHLENEIARHDYETLITPLLEKTLDCLQRCLSDAKITARQVDKIMLVGGATRTPFVHDLLTHRLFIEPHSEINPDLIVAMGAAIQGAALSGQPAPAILIDITAHTYSIGALIESHGNGYIPVYGCAPIIRRGTPLPVRKSDLFTTTRDAQIDIEIAVYQGEDHLPERNLEIGKFMIDGLAAVPAGNEVIVQFQIDLNGLLKVTATEKRTGLAKSAVIDTAGQHRLNLDTARTNLTSLFDEADAAHLLSNAVEDHEESEADTDEIEDTEDEAPATTAAPAGLLATAKSLRRRAEALIERGLAEKDSADIRARLSSISATVQQSDWKTLTTMTDQLSDVLFYLED